MTHNTIDQLRQQQHQRLQRLELMRDSVVDLVSIWGPLLVPLVPAGLTFAAIAANFPALLDIPSWGAIIIALITATALEILGIVSVETWLSMKSYNQQCTDVGIRAPEHLALTVVIIYAATVATLVFLLKIFHSLALWSLLPLTALGLLTSWIVVLRKQHNERVHQQSMAEHEQDEIERLNTLVEQYQAEQSKLTAQLNTARTEHDQAIEQLSLLTEQINTVQIEQSDLHKLVTDLRSQNRKLNNQLEQLNEQLDNVPTGQPIMQFVPGVQIQYKNGDILHGLEHLDTHDKIRQIAQRMTDSGQRINKSRIADLVGCARGTVQTALNDE